MANTKTVVVYKIEPIDTRAYVSSSVKARAV